jgi:hypothetical protein
MSPSSPMERVCEVGNYSIPKPTTPLVQSNEGGMEMEEQVQHVDNTDDDIYIVQYMYIDASDNANIADREEDQDNMMMFVFW